MDLSVIVPVYNAEKTLPNTLRSLLAQQGDFSWEIICVDDGSTDDSLAVLRSFEERAAERGVPFTLLTGTNAGVGHTRNRGLEAARGDAVLYLDADDLLLPGALQEMLRAKKENGARIVLFDSELLTPEGEASPFVSSDAAGGVIGARDYFLAKPCPWNKLVDRSLWTESGLRFPEGIWYEDLAVIPALGALTRPGEIFYLKKPLHRYYQSPGSITRGAYSEKRLDIFPALEALRRSTRGMDTELEYLAFLHLYRGFAWIFWDAGKREALERTRRYMKEHFPLWRKNPLIRARHTKKEILTASLFDRGCYALIGLWKGKRV